LGLPIQTQLAETDVVSVHFSHKRLSKYRRECVKNGYSIKIIDL